MLLVVTISSLHFLLQFLLGLRPHLQSLQCSPWPRSCWAGAGCPLPKKPTTAVGLELWSYGPHVLPPNPHERLTPLLTIIIIIILCLSFVNLVTLSLTYRPEMALWVTVTVLPWGKLHNKSELSTAFNLWITSVRHRHCTPSSFN